MNERETDFRINQHNVVKLRQQVTQLRLICFQELPSNRHVEEQVAHFDVRAHRTYAWFFTHYVRAVYLDQRTRLVFLAPCGHLHLSDSAYTCQRLASETHCTKGEQILRLAYLTRRMTLKSQTGIRLAHSDTIIDHL